MSDGPFKVLARYNNNAYKIDIPRDKYSVSNIFNVKDLSLYHGDEDFDPRSDLSQGRGDDAEHPKVSPMDLSSSHQVPSCSDPTSDGQVSMLKCHPWIGMLTYTVLEDL